MHANWAFKKPGQACYFYLVMKAHIYYRLTLTQLQVIHGSSHEEAKAAKAALIPAINFLVVNSSTA